jgi:hypothetical protein
MKTAKEIAQWVIDNRYPKSENESVPDVVMYHEIVSSIEELCNTPVIKKCSTCVDREKSTYVEPCHSCDENYSNYSN